jgi:hypothetical protein
MSVHIVRFSTDAERIPEVEAAIEALFAAVHDAAPAGIEYTAARVGDGAEFLLTLDLADTNPLLGIPEATEFRTRIAAWAGEPVPPQPLTVLGHYEAAVS